MFQADSLYQVRYLTLRLIVEVNLWQSIRIIEQHAVATDLVVISLDAKEISVKPNGRELRDRGGKQFDGLIRDEKEHAGR